MLFVYLAVCTQIVYALTVSETFQLFNVNDISRNTKNKLSQFPLRAGSSNSIVFGDSSGDIVTLQIDYNGFVSISGTNNYLTIDESDNYKLAYSDKSDERHIFFISQYHFHFDQYFAFVACPAGSDSSEYSLHVGNNVEICDGGVLVNLRPVSTVSGNAINQYIPDIMDTPEGVKIAAGSSIDFTITEDGVTTTVAGDSVTTSDSDSSSGSSKSSKSSSSAQFVTISATNQKTTTASDVGPEIIWVSKSYALSTYLTTVKVPVTSTYTSKDKDTVVIVTTVHISSSSSSCPTTVKTVYQMHTTINSHYTSTSLSLLSDFESSDTLSLLTTRLHNSTTVESTTNSSSGISTTTSTDSGSLIAPMSVTKLLSTSLTASTVDSSSSSSSSNRSNSTSNFAVLLSASDYTFTFMVLLLSLLL